MSDQDNAPRFGCPQCGSERIDEQTLVPFHYPVTAWTEDGEPAHYGERREIDAGTEVEDPRYWCNDCYHTFQRPVRREVEPAPTFPATGPRFGCPQCGDDRIREWNILGGWCAVIEWDETGAPLHFDGYTEVIWDVQRAADPERGEGDRYICGNGHMFNRPVRLDVDPAPTFPATGPRFGCPSCKSENITDNDFILRRRKVERWTEDGEPEVYGDARIGADTGEVLYDCLTCEDCGRYFMRPVRLDPDPDAEAKERGTL